MMKIKIHQISIDRDINRVMVMSLKATKKFQHADKIDRNIYDEVFSGSVDCRNLGDVFMVFNLYHPEVYRGRSLSVSDVVEVIESETTEPGYYFCDSFCFQKIEF